MNYFTEAWHNDMSDEAGKVVEAYQQHLASTAHRLPLSVRELAFETNLHDGLIRQIVLDGNALLVKLRCGDLQVGYFDLDLSYEQAALSAPDIKTLSELAQDKNASALYDEVDVEGLGVFAHRILFWQPLGGGTDRQVTILFQGLMISKVPQPNRDFVRLESRFPGDGTGAV